jgi:hypothetical protein
VGERTSSALNAKKKEEEEAKKKCFKMSMVEHGRVIKIFSFKNGNVSHL